MPDSTGIRFLFRHYPALYFVIVRLTGQSSDLPIIILPQLAYHFNERQPPERIC